MEISRRSNYSPDLKATVILHCDLTSIGLLTEEGEDNEELSRDCFRQHGVKFVVDFCFVSSFTLSYILDKLILCS